MTSPRPPITRFEGPAVVLAAENVDTDQIIPARFLKTTVRHGLGVHLFAGWRYAADGTPDPRFVLNHPAARGSSVLVAGRNFGCGSSREHAPWALLDFGFRAILAPSFADIFKQNSLKNGLLPIALTEDDHRDVSAQVEDAPGAVIGIDLVRQVVRTPAGREITFTIDPFARECLLRGIDEVGYVLAQEKAIQAYELTASRGPCPY